MHTYNRLCFPYPELPSCPSLLDLGFKTDLLNFVYDVLNGHFLRIVKNISPFLPETDRYFFDTVQPLQGLLDQRRSCSSSHSFHREGDLLQFLTCFKRTQNPY